ncbi:MAG: N-acetylmuramoyl-L-alanine amidase family protein [Tumebacillaceae bacterium]
MNRKRVFIHTLRLPRMRLVVLVPLVMVLILAIAAVPMWIDSQEVVIAEDGVEQVQVMIDPGHGGYDPGVMTPQYKEADITLAIGKQLEAELEKRGITAGLTRETDTDYAENGQKGKTAKRADLGKRVEMTEQKGAQVFVSLHCNNSSVASRGGAEVFYNEVPGGKEFGETVQKALHELPNMSKRDSKTVDYYLLRNQKIPALIIECGYLNIASDRARLTNPKYQAELATAIANGIERFLKSNPQQTPQPGQDQEQSQPQVKDTISA